MAKEIFQDAYEFSAALCTTAAAVPQYQRYKRALGKRRGERDTILRDAGRVETTGKSSMVFTQGASFPIGTSPKGEQQTYVLCNFFPK